MSLTIHPETKPFRILKEGPRRWNVMRYVGHDILGNAHFVRFSIHESKHYARQGLATAISAYYAHLSPEACHD
jgi:hypothetical protein